MSRADKGRTAQLKTYSRYLAADPEREAIWRNLTLDGMVLSGEYGFLEGHRMSVNKDRDLEYLFYFELERIVPVLSPCGVVTKKMEADFIHLIRSAATVWLTARRSIVPIEASQDVSWTQNSDWDLLYTEHIPPERECREDGVPISIMDDDVDSVCTRNVEDTRKVRLVLFPKIIRISQGSSVVIHDGIALFDGSLYSQGEEEVQEENIRLLEQQKLRRKKNFSTSGNNRGNSVTLSVSRAGSSRRASDPQAQCGSENSHASPNVIITYTPAELGSNHSANSVASENLVDSETSIVVPESVPLDESPVIPAVALEDIYDHIQHVSVHVS